MSRRARFFRRLALVAGFAAAAVLSVGAVAFAKRSPAPMDAPAFGSFLGPCNATADCAAGLTCQSYKQYGLRCTKSCETDSDCAAPSKGCSKQHRCTMPTATAGHPRQ
jgi:hypothetical protein